MLGMRSLPALDPDRYALTVVNQALGGGMSSRLFQEVREERGLAYSVYSYRAAFDDTGFLAIYAGTAPERVQETLDVIDDRARPARARRSARRASSTRRRATSRARSRCRSRRRRAACAASAAPSWSRARSRRSTRSSRASTRSTADDVAPGRSTACSRDAPRTLAVVGPHEAERLRGVLDSRA